MGLLEEFNNFNTSDYFLTHSLLAPVQLPNLQGSWLGSKDIIFQLGNYFRLCNVVRRFRNLKLNLKLTLFYCMLSQLVLYLQNEFV